MVRKHSAAALPLLFLFYVSNSAACLAADTKKAQNEAQAKATTNTSAPSDALQRAELISKTNPARMPLINTPQKPESVDIAAVFEKKLPNRTEPASNGMVMVSFSMPPESLVRIAQDARRAGLPLVLRGAIDGSLEKTTKAISELIKKSGPVDVRIDPKAFERYEVESVPALIIAPNAVEPGCQGDLCDANAHWGGVAGDVSIEYALDYLTQHSTSAAVMAIAQSVIARMKHHAP